MGNLALDHLTVIDLSGRIAGGFCTKFLADFGAEVIKVEPPSGGDGVRRAGPFKGDMPSQDGGAPHLFLNTNKSSVTLDVSTETGAHVLMDLAAEADVLVETRPPAAWEAMPLSLEEMEKRNPGLVIASITDFGQSGPYRDYKGTDIVHWGLGSLLWPCGLPGREPIRVGDDVSEYVAGLNAAGAILAAIYGRGVLGGQRIDVSVLESIITALPSTALGYSYSKTLATRSGNRFPISIMECRDGYVGFYTMLQHQWEFFTALVDMTHLQEDPRFATPLDRIQNADAAEEVFAPWFRERNVDDIVGRGQELRVPMVRVASAEDVAKNPQFMARGFFTDVGTEETGPVAAPGRPFNLSETPWSLRRPAPALGADNEAVYCRRLGLSKPELALLAERGII